MTESVSDLKRSKRARRQPPTNGDRLPPNSIENEQGVLGCVLIDSDRLPECLERIKSADVFYDPRHQAIWPVMVRVKRFDLVTLHQYLKDSGALDKAGGVAYLQELANVVPSAENLSYYLDIILEKYELRRVIQTCSGIVGRVYDFSGPIDDLMWSVRSELAPIVEGVDLQADQKCLRFKVSDLDKFDLSNDKDNLVGHRYLTRGSSLIVNGASGRGKSSLLMMRIILWALGRPFYGQRVVRPLSSIIWQTENNQGDLAKAFQGARNFLKLDSFEHEPEFSLLEKNIDFVYCPALCGREFLNFAQAELTKRPRDISVLDPLVSFPEDDLNGQKGAAEFLRKGLSRISFLTGTTWVINHHTPKPLRDPKKSSVTKRVSDYQYGGAGSFDIPGWARAVETLEEVADGVFRYVMAKRGGESGACHPDGTPTSILWLQHATSGGIHWEQVDPPQEPDPTTERKGGKPSVTKEIACSNLHSFLAACKAECEGLNEIAKRLESWLAKEKKDVSLNTCKRIVPLLVENGKLTKTNESLYQKGPNA